VQPHGPGEAEQLIQLPCTSKPVSSIVMISAACDQCQKRS
jgi:BarA-like signal transduction histidine kinase